MAVDGLVVDQDPRPPTKAHRGDTLTVHVWHPPPVALVGSGPSSPEAAAMTVRPSSEGGCSAAASTPRSRMPSPEGVWPCAPAPGSTGGPTSFRADIPLPPRSPELNPAENVWEYLRQRWLSNRIFKDYDAILDAVCDAWNRLIAEPDRIRSIGTRSWATTSPT